MSDSDPEEEEFQDAEDGIKSEEAMQAEEMEAIRLAEEMEKKRGSEDAESLASSDMPNLSVAGEAVSCASLTLPVGGGSLTDKTPIEATLRSVPHDHRPRLPVPRPKSYSGLWSALKSAIGRDLSKVAMPVQFNEPLSFIQRLCEDLEYSTLLDKAYDNPNSLIRLANVAAFTTTCFACNVPGFRVYKSFNPLLGETYELVRDGYRCIGEQVSHHPPVTTIYAESVAGWRFLEEYRADYKFRGTLKLSPYGVAKLEFPKHNEQYTWGKPCTTVHNLILGKVWTDQERDVVVMNHKTREKCVLAWTPYSSAGKDYTELTGKVYDAQGVIRYTLHGGWDKGFALLEGDFPKARLPRSEVLLADPAANVIYKQYPYPDFAAECYGMPIFSQQLNEPMDNICITDSRLRPDQRCLENGDLSAAAKEKIRVEEQQRAVRKRREASKESFAPRWFKEVIDCTTGTKIHVYTGGYWDCKAAGDFQDGSQFARLF